MSKPTPFYIFLFNNYHVTPTYPKNMTTQSAINQSATNTTARNVHLPMGIWHVTEHGLQEVEEGSRKAVVSGTTLFNFIKSIQVTPLILIDSVGKEPHITFAAYAMGAVVETVK